MSEKELVEGCLRNERSAQEQLYRRFFAPMMQMCLRYTRDEELAMSILNDGFLRVFKKIHLFGFKGSLEGWVRRLIWHSLADHFRNRKQGLHFLLLEDHDKPTPTKALQNLYAEDIILLVDRLPPLTQEVFRLFALEGYTHREIAEQLGMSPGTSKWHLSEARRRLKLLLENHNHSSYAG